MRFPRRSISFSTGSVLGPLLTLIVLAGTSVSCTDQKIVAPDAARLDRPGTSVAGLAVTSVSYADQKIVAPDAARLDRLGTSVAIDGDVVALGAPRADQVQAGAGSVRVQELGPGGVWNETAVLTASDAARWDELGSSVAVAGDTLVVGAPQANLSGLSNAGAAYVFTRSGQSWIETEKLVPASPQAGGLFGSAVGVDGSTVVVGAPGHTTTDGSRSGEVFVYTPDGAGWSEQATLTPSDARAQQAFGESIGIAGERVLVGAPRSDVGGATNAGTAYLFTRTGTSWSESAKLTASKAGAGDRFGDAVGLDGGVAVVGSPQADPSGSNSGAAYVFESASGWGQTAILEADDGGGGDMFGTSVTVDADLIAVGADGYDTAAGDSVGAVYRFERSGGAWPQVAVHTAADGAANDRYGAAVALSSDVLVVGAYRDDEPDAGGTLRSDAGSAYIVDLLGDAIAPDWGTAQLASSEITATSIELLWDAASDNAGVAGYLVYRDDVEIADIDTTTLVVTGLTPDTAYPFRIEAYDAAGNVTNDGPSASFSTTSAPGDAEAPGWTNGTLTVSKYALRVEAYDAAGGESTNGPMTTVTTMASTDETIVRPTGLVEADEAGESVAIENDRAVVSSRRANSQRGTLAVYERSGGVWEEIARLDASDGLGGDNLGFGGDGVALEGTTVLAGAWHADPVAGNSGAAYVFVEGASGAWTEQQKLVPQLGQGGASFGRSVALSGNVAVIGAPDHDGAGGTNSGRAYVFERSGGVWTETAMLEAQDSSSSQRFGYSVAIDGTRMTIGARGDNELGSNAGAAYVFEKVGGAWIEQQKLQGADTQAGDRFGESVALSGDVVIAGAPREDQGASSTGAAYVFDYDGATWQQSAKLYDESGAGGFDEFGVNVGASGTAVLVGAHQHDAAGSNAGAVYLYGKSGLSWVPLGQKLLASDASVEARFGRSVSLSGGTALIGANLASKAYFVEVDTSAPGDAEAPGWTSGTLTVSNETDTAMDLAWAGASDNVAVAGYRVYDDGGASPVLLVDVADGTATGATLTGLTASTTYALRVEAYDAAGLESSGGPTATAMTVGGGGDTEAPGWTSGTLTVSNETDTAMDLAWAGASDNVAVAGYRVYDDGGASPALLVDVADGTATGATLTGLTASTTYALRVEAYDAAGLESSGGPTATAMTAGGGGGSSPPSWSNGQLSVTAVTASSATFAWSGASDDVGVVGYRLFDNDGTQIADVAATSYTETGLAVDDFYHVRVEAYDADDSLSTDGPAFGGRFPFAKLVAPVPGDDELFGGAIALDGDTALVTALHTDLPVDGSLRQKVGKAYVYTRQDLSWRLEAELVADDGFTSDLFGYDADLDGDVAIVGAWHANPNGVADAGAAYVFRRSGSAWVQEQKLVADTLQANADFGIGVAIEGDLAVVGAHEADVGGFSTAGTVTVFERTSGAWNAVATLSADTPQNDQAFGRSVAIDAGRIVVGAAREDHPGAPDGGAMYVFEKSDGSWSQSARLVTDDVASADLVGIDVAIDDTTIVTVARDDDLGSNAGAAYVFEYDGSAWQQEAKLLAPDGAVEDSLAFRAAVSGDVVAAGAFRHDVGPATEAGAAYVFRKANGAWEPLPSQSKFTAADAAANDHYGIAVALDGATLMVGSELDGLSGAELDAYLGVPDGTSAATVDSGSVWFYELDLN